MADGEIKTPQRGIGLNPPKQRAPVDRGEPERDPPDRDEAIAAGREGFRQSGRIPWYNDEKDGLRPIRVLTDWGWDWNFGGLAWLGYPMFWLLVAVITLALVAAGFWIIRLWSHRRPAPASARSGDETETIIEGVAALPFLQRRSRDDLIGHARRHYAEGNYSEAIVYLFSHELVELDRTALVQLALGKTNRQYLRELVRVPRLVPLVEQTMQAFESVFFGGRALDRAGFEACWNQLGQFDQFVAAARGNS